MDGAASSVSREIAPLKPLGRPSNSTTLMTATTECDECVVDAFEEYLPLPIGRTHLRWDGAPPMRDGGRTDPCGVGGGDSRRLGAIWLPMPFLPRMPFKDNDDANSKEGGRRGGDS